jgi:hypothetical protein
MLAFRSVMSTLSSFVVRSFSTNSRPALRVAACGGRPRAGSATFGNREAGLTVDASPAMAQQLAKLVRMPEHESTYTAPILMGISLWLGGYAGRE